MIHQTEFIKLVRELVIEWMHGYVMCTTYKSEKYEKPDFDNMEQFVNIRMEGLFLSKFNAKEQGEVLFHSVKFVTYDKSRWGVFNYMVIGNLSPDCASMYIGDLLNQKYKPA